MPKAGCRLLTPPRPTIGTTRRRAKDTGPCHQCLSQGYPAEASMMAAVVALWWCSTSSFPPFLCVTAAATGPAREEGEKGGRLAPPAQPSDPSPDTEQLQQGHRASPAATLWHKPPQRPCPRSLLGVGGRPRPAGWRRRGAPAFTDPAAPALPGFAPRMSPALWFCCSAPKCAPGQPPLSLPHLPPFIFGVLVCLRALRSHTVNLEMKSPRGDDYFLKIK